MTDSLCKAVVRSDRDTDEFKVRENGSKLQVNKRVHGQLGQTFICAEIERVRTVPRSIEACTSFMPTLDATDPRPRGDIAGAGEGRLDFPSTSSPDM
eukprot:391166-Prorocentrum_minimum.AAC.1